MPAGLAPGIRLVSWTQLPQWLYGRLASRPCAFVKARGLGTAPSGYAPTLLQACSRHPGCNPGVRPEGRAAQPPGFSDKARAPGPVSLACGPAAVLLLVPAKPASQPPPAVRMRLAASWPVSSPGGHRYRMPPLSRPPTWSRGHSATHLSERANRIRTRSAVTKTIYGDFFRPLGRAFYRTPRADPEKSRRSHPEGPYPQDRRPGFARKEA